MFMFNTSSKNFEEEHPHQDATNDRIAKEVSEENQAHVAENKILKEHKKSDHVARNKHEKQISDIHFARAKIAEAEKHNKQVEYRDFLLQQIEDKKKRDGVGTWPAVQGNAYTYSEELMTPELTKNAKLTKQHDMKEGLDECIRMKTALKLGEKEIELEEDRARLDFVKNRDMNEELAKEHVKQQSETKEQRREELSMQWKAMKNDDREQFIELLRKDTTLLDLSEDTLRDGMKESEVDVEEEMLKNGIKRNKEKRTEEMNKKLENSEDDDVGHHRYF